MSCACIGADIEGEPCDLYNETNPKAKVIHKCNECHRKIYPGEYYQHIKFLFEGDFGVHKVCQDCISVTKELFCYNSPMGGIWDYIEFYIEDVQENILSCDMSKLTKTARNKVCDLIEKYWEREDNE